MAQAERVQADPDEPVPLYSAQAESGSSSNPFPPGPPPAFKTKPTNFFSLSTECTPIRGEFVIDPSIRIPSSLLPKLGWNEQDRKNLSLTSTDGSLDTEIWLLPPSPSSNESATRRRRLRRTTIALISDNGSIRAQLRTIKGATPFLLTGRALYGTVRLALPPSFHGLLSLSTSDGNVTLGDTLARNTAQLSQVDNTRQYFVGDIQALGEDAWEGDQVEIETLKGCIRVKYAAEGRGKLMGLMSRLFGT